MEQMREGRNGGKLKSGGATNGGRPKKVFSVIIAEMKERGIEPATPSNVADIYQYLLALPLSEIIKIAGKPSEENDLPAIMRIAAKELIGKRGLEIMKEMLDRANGKPKTSLELSNPDGTMKQTIIFSDGTTRDERGNIVEKADH